MSGKAGRPELPEEKKRIQQFRLLFTKEEYDSLKNASKVTISSTFSKFLREMLFRGIQATKEKGMWPSKDIHPPIPDKNIIRDIIEYLMSEPSDYGLPATKELMIWKIEDIEAVLRQYPIEDIKDALSSNQDIFEYIPGKRWRLLDQYKFE